MTQRKALEQFFQLFNEGRMDEWLTLLHADIRASAPLAPQGSETAFNGIEAVRARFCEARANMTELEFYDIEISPLQEPDRFVVECRSKGEFRGGIRYQNTYCMLFRFDRDLIVEWIQYFDPQELIAVETARAENEGI